MTPDADSIRISIHALRVEGDPVVTPDADSIRISIHALRVEGDDAYFSEMTKMYKFLSTPSGWRATI